MGPLDLTPINPESREFQSCPQLERKRRLLPCQRHRLLETLLSRTNLFGFAAHKRHAFRQKEGRKVKRPLQAKLRCDRTVDESQRFRALVLFCQANRQFGDKICYEHFVSQNPQLLQAILQMTYAIPCPADVDQVPSPEANGDGAKWLQRILFRGELELGEVPLDLFQMTDPEMERKR